MTVKLSLLPHVNYGTVYPSTYDKRHQYKVLKRPGGKFFSRKPTEFESFYSLISSFLWFPDSVI